MEATQYVLSLSREVPGLNRAPITSEPFGTHERPIPEIVRQALPARYRRAFDRAGSWWRDRHAAKPFPVLHVQLTDARGRYLTTVYATPVEEDH